MMKDLGLDPNWDSHGFSDQQDEGCGCADRRHEPESVMV
jgi:hypothetical protein